MLMGVGVLANAAAYAIPVVAATLLLFVLLPVGTGFVLLRDPHRLSASESRLLEARARTAWDAELMRLAERRSGSLTVAEVVAHADLDAERAEQCLDDLCKRGIAEHRVTDGGEIVYRFRAAPSAADKLGAKGVLDDD